MTLFDSQFRLFLTSFGIQKDELLYFEKRLANSSDWIRSFLDLLHARGVPFIEINMEEWRRYKQFPAIVIRQDGSAIFVTSDHDFGEISKLYYFADNQLLELLKNKSWNLIGKRIFKICPRQVLGLILFVVVGKLMELGMALQFQNLLNLLTQQNTQLILSPLIGWILFRLIDVNGRAFLGFLESRLALELGKHYFSGLLCYLSRRFKTDDKGAFVGECFTSISTLASTLQSVVTLVFKFPIQLIFATGYILILISYDFRLPLLAFGFLLLSLLLKLLGYNPQKRLKENEISTQRDFTEIMSSLIANMGILKSHGAIRWGREIWQQKLSDVLNAQKTMALFSQFFSIFENLLSHSIFFLSFYLISGPWKLISEGEIGTAGMLSLMVSFTFSALDEVSDCVTLLSNINASVSTLPDPPLRESCNVPHESELLFEVENVSLGYSDNLVLDQVSFKLEKGKSYAFVGKNGSGKSTMIKALRGVLHVRNGVLKSSLIERDIITISKADRLFSGTLLENFFVESSDENEARVYDCLKMVAMEDWFDSQPLGFKTQVGEKGIGLSGGENLRILVARALFLAPKLLILDEATASLDLGTEALLLQNIRFAEGLESIIIITHRNETIELVDEAFEFKNFSVKRIK